MRPVVLLVLVLPLACRGGHDEAKAEPATSATTDSDLYPARCPYLSTREAATLTGLPFTSGVPDRKCQWLDAKGSVVVTVSLTDSQTHYEKELKIFPNHQDVVGVGDQAFVMGPVIGVRAGSHFFTLSGIITADPHSVTTERLISAARAINARLPP